MKSYQVFLRNAGKPIGITGMIAIIVLTAVHLGTLVFSTPEQHKEFAEACTLQDGTVRKIEGNHWCVKGNAIDVSDGFPLSVPRWFQECRARGGIVYNPNRSVASDEQCIKQEIVTELGERDDYTGGQ